MNFQQRSAQIAARLMGFNLLLWLTMLVSLAGILMLAAAAYLALKLVLATALAALLTGIGLLVVAGLLMLAVRLRLHSLSGHTPRRFSLAPAERPATKRPDATGTTTVRDSPAATWLRNNPDIAIAGALVLGVALTASPALRRLTMRTLAPALGSRALRAVLEERSMEERNRQ